jgi:hypothetical protein
MALLFIYDFSIDPPGFICRRDNRSLPGMEAARGISIIPVKIVLS